MKKNVFYIFYIVGSLLLINSVSSCSGKKKPVNGRTDTPTSGTITFYADESFSPIIEELRQQFEYEYPNAHLKPVYTDETTGLKQIQDLKTQLLITSRGLLPSEIAYLETKRQVPRVSIIGYDGLAFIVNRNNNDTCMTVNDVKRVLSGQVTDWNELYPGSNRGEIEVVFDNKQSATVHFVIDSILDGKAITSPNVVGAKCSKDVIDYVDKTPNAIGVIGSNWLNDKRGSTNTTFKKNIHVMSISIKDKATPSNSWKPYQAYLLDGRYPFYRTLYAICTDPLSALPWSFMNYICKPKGQLIIFKSGLLPYRGDITFKKVEVNR